MIIFATLSAGAIVAILSGFRNNTRIAPKPKAVHKPIKLFKPVAHPGTGSASVNTTK